MGLRDADAEAINSALLGWRQGDVCLDPGLEFFHLADLTRPHSPASVQVAEYMEANGETPGPNPVPILDEVRGVVMLSQTCDVVRDCAKRPFVEVAPLVEMPDYEVGAIRRLKRPAFAYVPVTANDCLVGDLDRVMTVEKALVAEWWRVPGSANDEERREFAQALARKRSRFAFPDDFVAATQLLQKRLIEKHSKQNEEGSHLRVLREIRVNAAPSWCSDSIQLSWWFIKDSDPVDTEANWTRLLDQWLDLFDQTGRYDIDARIACELDDMTARDYVESDLLDLDRLSAPG